MLYVPRNFDASRQFHWSQLLHMYHGKSHSHATHELDTCTSWLAVVDHFDTCFFSRLHGILSNKSCTTKFCSCQRTKRKALRLTPAQRYMYLYTTLFIRSFRKRSHYHLSVAVDSNTRNNTTPNKSASQHKEKRKTSRYPR